MDSTVRVSSLHTKRMIVDMRTVLSCREFCDIGIFVTVKNGIMGIYDMNQAASCNDMRPWRQDGKKKKNRRRRIGQGR